MDNEVGGISTESAVVLLSIKGESTGSVDSGVGRLTASVDADAIGWYSGCCGSVRLQ